MLIPPVTFFRVLQGACSSMYRLPLPETASRASAAALKSMRSYAAHAAGAWSAAIARRGAASGVSAHNTTQNTSALFVVCMPAARV